jgi:hypothetical protein
MTMPTRRPPEVGLEVELAALLALGPGVMTVGAAAGLETRLATTNGESEVVVPQTVAVAGSAEVVTSSQLVPFQWSNRTRLGSGSAIGSYGTQNVIEPVCVAVVETS